MIHKSRLCLIFLMPLFTLAGTAHAERRAVSVTETSSSGRLVRLNVGGRAGLEPNSPVLFSAGDRKVAAGRVVRADGHGVIVAVLEKYGTETPAVDFEYDLLFGEPFPEADNLPDYIADRDSETSNPGDERFFTADGKELAPELDDDNYTPETTLRPKMPEPSNYSPHNITIGLGMFRNHVLPTVDTGSTTTKGNSGVPFTTYQGWSIRYAYTFRSHYWLRSDAMALISAELTFGIYNFNHTLPNSGTYAVRVTPVGIEFRYMVEVNKLLKLYPYVGYQNNFAGATGALQPGTPATTGADVTPVKGGRLLGGAGAQLLMSQTIDARVEGGSDGFLAGMVVKF
ncbi:MAG: hypothetical protein ACXWQO_04630 [Bdellovibrionota bacterium]